MKCEDCQRYYRCEECVNQGRDIKCPGCINCDECAKLNAAENVEKLQQKAKDKEEKEEEKKEKPEPKEVPEGVNAKNPTLLRCPLHEACPDCANLKDGKKGLCKKCTTCPDCQLVRLAEKKKAGQSITICPKCESCANCVKLRRTHIPACTDCTKKFAGIGSRMATVYCESEHRMICSMCAAKYHRTCTQLYDTYDLVIRSCKLIDEEMIAAKGHLPASGAEPRKLAPAGKQELAEITREEIKQMHEDITNSKDTLIDKAGLVLETITKYIKKTIKSVGDNYLKLDKKLTDLDNELARLESRQDNRITTLERQRGVLQNLIKDEHFETVVVQYQGLQQKSESGGVINERSTRMVRQQVNTYKNNETIQNLEKQIELLTQEKGKSGVPSSYQDFQNIVYYLTPYSYHMYTYDVDTNTASIIKLVDETGKEFRMKFNSSTLCVNNRIFFIGGTEHLSDCGKGCWEYRLLFNNVKEFKSMNIMRREHSVVFANNCIYSVGGWIGEEEVAKGAEGAKKCINKGLTDTCEKIRLDEPGSTNNIWEPVRKLNAPKSAVSLTAFEESKAIYAICGLTKDPKASRFEKLSCINDIAAEKSAGTDHSNEYWEIIDVKDPDKFCEQNPMIGSFGYEYGNEDCIMLFIGGTSKEDSKAYCFTETEKILKPAPCPKIAGTASLHNRRPLYTNSKQDIYFVAFYDILHFNAEKAGIAHPAEQPQWVKPISTKEWISYK